jgi:alanine-glyoxylate transaminase / (R)-3-amino-2-methylpropionate-pyruvate transaminase
MELDTLKKRQQYIYASKKIYFKEPVEIIRASGSRVWDSQNNEYLDGIGGIVTISVGHNHPRIKKVIQGLLDSDHPQHISSLFLSPYMPEAGRMLSKHFKGDSRVYFVNSGSEANEVACLSAREYTGKKMIISLRHGYHGGTNATLNLCGHSSWKYQHQPHSDVGHIEAPYCYRCPYDKKPATCSLECAVDLDKFIETCTSGDVAGVIVEPIQGVGGFITPPLSYYKKIYEIIKDHGGLYISDEVQTGVGRLGKNFFGAYDGGIEPDIFTMAKGLGNGVPVGAVVAKKEVSDSIKHKTHFNTFGGDPFQMAQVCEVLNIIEQEKLMENAHVQGEKLIKFFNDLKSDFPCIGDVRGRGLLLGVEIIDQGGGFDPICCDNILNKCKDNGLLLGKGGLKGNVLRIAPSLAISDLEVEELMQKFRASL